jgi:hypothetical protein
MKQIITLGVIGGILFFTNPYATVTVDYVHEAEAAPEPKVVLIEVHPEQLDRIADCESGARNKDGSAVKGSARHSDDKGVVITGTHAEVGIDVGWCQLNTYYHLDEARELGLNIFEEGDNKTYCRKLYKEQGTEPWTASKECWDR